MPDVILPTATIYLHGALKRKFGGPYKWGVQTPAEAIRALDRMKPGFRDALREGDWMLVRGPRHGGIDLGVEMLDFRLGDGGALHIIPAVKGRGGKNGGVGKIVAGVALVALAVVAPYAAGAGYAGFAGAAGAYTVAGVSASSIGMMGLGLIFSGAASLLSPQPKTSRPVEKEAVAQNPSFMFDGPSMGLEQGRIVPVIYGRKIRTGGVLISSAYDTEDVNKAGSAAGLPPDGTEGWRLDTSDGTMRWYKDGALFS